MIGDELVNEFEPLIITLDSYLVISKTYLNSLYVRYFKILHFSCMFSVEIHERFLNYDLL